MAIIFRGTKGTPLTHDELDNNFREFYYSASYSGNVITLFKSQSNAEPFRLPYPTASGYDTYVQLKSGNNQSGSNEFLTSSPNFRFNYSSSILHVTGTYEHKGNVNINGVLTAQKYVTTLVSSSVVYTSGSTQFGDTADDLHTFTGKLYVEGSEQLVGPFTQSGNQRITGNQIFTGNKTQTGTLTLVGSHLQTGNTERTGTLEQVGTTTITGSLLVTGSTSQIGNITQTGNLTRTGNTTLNGNITHVGNTTQTGNITVTNNIEVGNDVEIGNNLSITGSTIIEGTIVGKSSTVFGDNVNETHSFTGSVSVTGTTTANAFVGDGSQVLNVVSSSHALVADAVPYTGLTGTATIWNQDTTGNAATATALESARTIGGVSFNGTANINLPGVNTTGNQNTSGNAATATKLATARTIGGVSFDGSANINLPGVNAVGNQNTSGNAATSTTASYALYAETAGNGGLIATYTNPGNNRLITSVDGTSINAESLLTWDGLVLTINGSSIKDFTSSDTDVTGLVGGTTSGTLIQSKADGHIVLGIRDNETSDSFAVVSGDGGFYAGNAYTKLAFQVSGSGQTYVGGNLTVDGSVSATGDITAFASSDERLKDNITPIQGALGKINQIGGYEFDWNDNSEHSGHDVGVIAQEIEKVLPEIVVNRDNGYKAVRYEKIVALLIQAVKEQQLQIDELKSKL